MAAIKSPNGKVRQVKNLGWLLRNWKHVESLEWINASSRNLNIDGLFRAYMRDGRVYATTYASFEVWKGFINRPVFRGLEVTVNGIKGRV